jgi:hypothetical protein
MTTTHFIVFSNPVEGEEDEYNRWYDDVHLPDVVAVDGVVAGQRYEHVPVESEGGARPTHRYLAIYELDGDPNTVLKTFTEQVASGQMPLSEGMDMTTIAMAMWQPRGDRIQK